MSQESLSIASLLDAEDLLVDEPTVQSDTVGVATPVTTADVEVARELTSSIFAAVSEAVEHPSAVEVIQAVAETPVAEVVQETAEVESAEAAEVRTRQRKAADDILRDMVAITKAALRPTAKNPLTKQELTILTETIASLTILFANESTAARMLATKWANLINSRKVDEDTIAAAIGAYSELQQS